MKTCSYCGRENEAVASVCRECGTTFQASQLLREENLAITPPATMGAFICTSCGKQWPESYCPECSRTIDAASGHRSTTTQQVSPESDLWSGKTPKVLKQPEGRARVWAAIGGIILGGCVAALCYSLLPHKSIVGRMFDFSKVEVVVPVSIVAVFFWGLFLCWYRWRLVRVCERASSSKLLTAATSTLSEKGVRKLVAQLQEPVAEFNPLLRRLKALVSQWQLKPGLVEADLVLQQFVADDEESTRRAYSLVRTFVWALPVLGLIGTVLGIAFAVGGFGEFLGGREPKVRRPTSPATTCRSSTEHTLRLSVRRCVPTLNPFATSRIEAFKN
jgi:biopolymer transport protein ExbB/TolQ